MYLNVDEIDSKIELLADQFANLCSRFSLPNRTHGNRSVWGLRVQTSAQRIKHGVLIIAGVHAREWPTCDAVLHFVEAILNGYQSNTGVQFGNKTFTAAEVRLSLDSVELTIVPCVNPDGRDYSMQPGNDERNRSKTRWRKNRRDNGVPTCWGVDINRNYDWLWDFRTKLHPASVFGNPQFTGCQGEVHISDFPCDETYNGPASFSEPETQNIKHLLDNAPSARLFVDVHGAEVPGLVLTPWGDDEVQSADAAMTFLNTNYDGMRGLSDLRRGGTYCSSIPLIPAGPTYKEYMHPDDYGRYVILGNFQRDAMITANNRQHITGPGYLLLYGITGGSKDYVFGRHLVDPTLSKIDAYLYEYVGSFWPPYENPPGPDDAIHAIHEISAGLTELLRNADQIPFVDVTPPLVDFGKMRVGTTAVKSVVLRNRGPRAISISPVNLLLAPASFSAAMTGSSTLASGNTKAIQLKCTPAGPGVIEGLLEIRFRYPGGPPAIPDVRLVRCTVRACQVPVNACVAPVFQPMGILECILLFLTLPAVIAALLLLIWIPGVYCAIRKLVFILQNCSRGNSDPCIVLLRNRFGFQ